MKIMVDLNRIQKTLDNLNESLKRWTLSQQNYITIGKECTDEWEKAHNHKMELFCKGQIDGLQTAIDDFKTNFPELEHQN